MTKGQNKGMMGAVTFEVKAQAQLTEEERQLIQHYKMENEVLLSKKLVNIWGQPTDHDVKVSVRQLVTGEGYKCKDLGEVISYSDSLKSACSTLKAYLDVARGFGGQETFDID
jgi:hypothetical protein